MGPDGRPAKGHSSRKNKPQRCSVCGGIGHKSRTCSMAVTPNAQAMCPPVQWAATQPGADPNQPQMYMVQNAAGGWQPAQPGQVQMVGGVAMQAAPGAMMMQAQGPGGQVVMMQPTMVPMQMQQAPQPDANVQVRACPHERVRARGRHRTKRASSAPPPAHTHTHTHTHATHTHTHTRIAHACACMLARCRCSRR